MRINLQQAQENKISIKKIPKRNSTLEYMKKNKRLYFLLIPGLLYLFVFKYIPMYGIIIAFKDFNIIQGIWKSDWIGLLNFEILFKSKDFYKVLANSLVLSFYQILWGFPVPIILSLMLNEVRSMAFKRISQTILYFPHFISWVIICGMIMNFLSPSTGVVNHIIQALGGEPVPFLLRPEYFRSIIVTAEIWKGAGWGTIVYLGAIASVPPELYESAKVDGANRMQNILYITLPSILSTIVVLLIMNLGSVLSNGFEQIFLLYNPATYETADVFETYTYRIGLQSGRFSYSTAVGLFKSVVGFILVLGSNWLSRRVNEKSIW